MISFNLINYAAGLTAVSWWTFTWATGIGILPLTFLMVAIGDGLWSGAGELWPWLLAAAAAGWLLVVGAGRPPPRQGRGAHRRADPGVVIATRLWPPSDHRVG